jgi:hypothetical protein
VSLDFDAGYFAGKKMMLELILAESEVFEKAMKKRRYVNNAAGVRRFREHLETAFPATTFLLGEDDGA